MIGYSPIVTGDANPVVNIHNNLAADTEDIYIHVTREGNIHPVLPIELKISESPVDDYIIRQPTIRVRGFGFIQAIVDGLNRAGLKEKGQELEAIKYHLADMRRLVRWVNGE